MAIEMEPRQETTNTQPNERRLRNTYSPSMEGYSPITSGIPQQEIDQMHPGNWNSQDGRTPQQQRIWEESISIV